MHPQKRKTRKKLKSKVHPFTALVIISFAGLALLIFLSYQIKPLKKSENVVIPNAKELARKPVEPDYHITSTPISYPLRGKHGEMLLGWGKIISIALSPTGRYVAASASYHVMLWDLNTNKEKPTQIFTIPNKPQRMLRFTPDEKQLLITDHDGHLHLMDIKSAQETMAFRPHPSGPIQSIAFSPTLDCIATVGSDMYAKVWNLGKPECLYLFRCNNRPKSLAFSPDGKELLTGGMLKSNYHLKQNNDQNIMELWSLTNKEPIRVYEGYPSDINQVAFSSDGNQVMAGGKHGVMIWDKNSGKVIKKPENPIVSTSTEEHDETEIFRGSSILSSTFSSDRSQFLVFITPQWKIKILDIYKNEYKSLLNQDLNNIQLHSLSQDWKTILLKQNSLLRLLDVDTGLEKWNFDEFTSDVNQLAFRDNNTKAEVHYRDGSVKWFDLTSGQLVEKRIPAHNTITSTTNTPIQNAKNHSPSYRVVYREKLDSSFNYQRKLNTAWNTTLDKEEKRFQPLLNKAVVARFIEDSKRLIACYEKGNLTIWDSKTLEEIETYHFSEFKHLKHVTLQESPDHQYLLAILYGNSKNGDMSSSIKLINKTSNTIDSFDLTLNIDSSSSIPLATAMTTNNQWLAIGSMDGIQLINLKTGEIFTKKENMIFNINTLGAGKFLIINFLPKGQSGRLKSGLFDTQKMEIIHIFENRLYYSAISDDYSKFMTAFDTGIVHVWDMNKLRGEQNSDQF